MLCTLQHCTTADILRSNPQKLVGLPKILLLLQEAKDQHKDEALKGGGVFTVWVINTSATGLMQPTGAPIVGLRSAYRTPAVGLRSAYRTPSIILNLAQLRFTYCAASAESIPRSLPPGQKAQFLP